MTAFSDALSDEIEAFKTALYCPAIRGSFKPLSSKPASKHGFSPTGGLADEIHEWPKGDLRDVVRKGMGARRQPMEALITTAGVANQGYGWEVHDYAAKVLSGVIVDPTFLAVIFAADPDDDWTDEAVWAKANPNLGVSLKLDFLRQECAMAKTSPRLENDFKRFHLNLWTEQAVRWLPMESWRACTRDPENPDLWRELEAELAGRRCWGGLDLASTQDTTSLVLCFPPEGDETRWTFLYRFWLPEFDLAGRAARDRMPYQQWARAGALMLTDGRVTDYAAVREQIFKDGEMFALQDLAIDRWNATHLATELDAEGLTVEFFGQGYASMSAPSKRTEELVLEEAIEHGNHPVARVQAASVSVTTDPAGNIKPDKAKSTQRIDGMVAQIMALARASVHQEDDAVPAIAFV